MPAAWKAVLSFHDIFAVDPPTLKMKGQEEHAMVTLAAEAANPETCQILNVHSHVEFFCIWAALGIHGLGCLGNWACNGLLVTNPGHTVTLESNAGPRAWVFSFLNNINCLNASDPSPGGAARTRANAPFLTKPASSPYDFADLCLTSPGALLISRSFDSSSVVRHSLCKSPSHKNQKPRQLPKPITVMPLVLLSAGAIKNLEFPDHFGLVN